MKWQLGAQLKSQHYHLFALSSSYCQLGQPLSGQMAAMVVAVAVALDAAAVVSAASCSLHQSLLENHQLNSHDRHANTWHNFDTYLRRSGT